MRRRSNYLLPILLLYFCGSGRWLSSRHSLPPIVNPRAPERFDPRGNMLWIEGREIIWTIPDAAGRKRARSDVKRVTPGFYMDRTEVTNEDFAQYLSQSDSNRVYYDSRMDIVEVSHGQYRPKAGREKFPVAWVDWMGAFAFRKMAQKSLPTEDEWVTAALAGRSLRADTVQYVWTDSSRCNRLLHAAAFPGRTAVDGDSSANGVYDLAGNVAEWTLTEETSALVGGHLQKWAVIKGGSFLDPAAGMTIFSRALRDRSERLSSVGFRCILREPHSH